MTIPRGALLRAPTCIYRGEINSCCLDKAALAGLFGLAGCSAVGSAYGWGP